MTNSSKLKIYKKEYDYSYTLGAYPTIELLKNKPDKASEVIVHSSFTDLRLIKAVCKSTPIVCNDKIFERLGVKDNSFVIGVFRKYDMLLNPNKPHIVLVNPSDMGNLGTIIRTVLGFGYKDLAIITPAADMWNPKTLRASMGAVFHVNIQCFCSFQEYALQYSKHKLFPFMLGGNLKLSYETCPKTPLFSLIFGNEATGLEKSFLSVGQPILIPQTKEIDSINLAVAAAVGAYTFAAKNSLLMLQ